jgi:hypothetical protein
LSIAIQSLGDLVGDQARTGNIASFNTPRRNQELPRLRQGIESLSTPPGLLVAKAMVVPVMFRTEEL